MWSIKISIYLRLEDNQVREMVARGRKLVVKPIDKTVDPLRLPISTPLIT